MLELIIILSLSRHIRKQSRITIVEDDHTNKALDKLHFVGVLAKCTAFQQATLATRATSCAARARNISHRCSMLLSYRSCHAVQEASREEDGIFIKDGIIVVTKGAFFCRASDVAPGNPFSHGPTCLRHILCIRG